ncbi:hypothetical protein [Corynebacterium sp.]|uniref:hypothetical protein n=1 Tax=Corynebacterium sp. TaxID=1720 RepID=UPI0026DCB7F1|nr:hypothetical protein [Corynebacterium sp.]MDO4915968.1 hypothetical protein [Corynebacterium sp.]
MSAHATENSQPKATSRQAGDFYKPHSKAVTITQWVFMISCIILLLAGFTENMGASANIGWVLAMGTPALLIGWSLYCRKRDATSMAQWQAGEAERQKLLGLLGEDDQLVASGLVKADKPAKRNRHWILTGGATAAAIVIGASMLPQDTPTTATPASVVPPSTSQATPKPLFDTKNLTPATKTKTITAVQTVTRTTETTTPEPAPIEQAPIADAATAGANNNSSGGHESGGSVGGVNPGSFCPTAGAVTVSSHGKPVTCRTAKDGRLRWKSA